MFGGEPFQINQQVLRAHLKSMEELIASAPQHVLDEVFQRQQIDAHNAAIEEAKAKKKHFRDMAKAAHVSVDVLRSMIGSVQRTK